RLVGGVFQCHVTTCRRHYGCTQNSHTLNVGSLAFHIHLAHIHHTLHSHECAHSSSSHTVLSGTGFCDDLLFTQTFCQENLADSVVHLVRSCMTKVFAFQVDLRFIFFRKPVGKIQRRRTANVVLQQVMKFLFEIFSLDDIQVAGPEFFHVG